MCIITMNQAKELNYPIHKNYSAGSSPIKSNQLFLIMQKAPKVHYMTKHLTDFKFFLARGLQIRNSTGQLFCRERPVQLVVNFTPNLLVLRPKK